MSLKAPPPTPGDRDDVAFAGLCATCRHLQVLRSKRSTFVRCGRADHDPRFARYPPLPVLWCRGLEVEEEPGSAGQERCRRGSDPGRAGPHRMG